MNIQANSVVSIDYTVTDNDGAVIDSSEGRAPLVYLHGFQNIIPGLEKALEGKATGDDFAVEVKSDEAYGPYQAEMVQEVPLSAFQGVDKVEEGMQFTAQSPQGPVHVVVKEVNDENVTIDGNHPLAGKDLNFKGSVVEVREATAEELEHGHVHGEGGHEH